LVAVPDRNHRLRSLFAPFCFDSAIPNNCHGNTNSCTPRFGWTDTNDTDLDGQTFVAGSAHFQMTKIEASWSAVRLNVDESTIVSKQRNERRSNHIGVMTEKLFMS
jgi:hypothetical protein